MIFTYLLYYKTISGYPLLMEYACKFCLHLRSLCNIFDEQILLKLLYHIYYLINTKLVDLSVTLK